MKTDEPFSHIGMRLYRMEEKEAFLSFPAVEYEYDIQPMSGVKSFTGILIEQKSAN